MSDVNVLEAILDTLSRCIGSDAEVRFQLDAGSRSLTMTLTHTYLLTHRAVSEIKFSWDMLRDMRAETANYILKDNLRQGCEETNELIKCRQP